MFEQHTAMWRGVTVVTAYVMTNS